MLTIAELIAVMRFTFDAFNTSTYSGRTLSLTECSDHPTVDIIQSAQILVLITVFEWAVDTNNGAIKPQFLPLSQF